MSEKISFAISDAKLIDENPNSSFSILELDFFSSGKNLHDMFVSDIVLEKTANTIRNCPLVWQYDRTTQDAGNHHPEEVPCGFIPESAEIKTKKMPDGRSMLSTTSYVWKKYSGKILDFFKRDGEKPISVEMMVFDTSEREDGLLELLDYKFEAVTILGSLVKPAIPMARATVLQFSKEYAEALQEFSNKYSDVDFKIPEKVKKNANKGLELHKQFGGATSVALAAGRHLANNESISVEKVRHIAKYLESHKNKSRDEKSVDSGYVGWQMYGGNDAYEWSTNVVKQLDEIDNKKLSFFGKDEDNRTEKNESKKEDMTVDLKEKDKPKEEEVKEEEMAVEEKKEMLSEDDLKMAAEQKPEEKPEDPKEESEEKSAEEADEEKKEAKEEKMSLDSNLDIAAILAMLEDETEDYRMLVESHTNGNMDFSKLCYALYAKMCKMSEESKVASEDNDAYMSEFEALKKFKVDEEAKKFSYEVESTLNSVSEYMPKEELSKAREESVNFSIDTIDAWKNMVRATAFNFSKDKKPSDGITRIGLPFAGIENRKVNSVWTRD